MEPDDRNLEAAPAPDVDETRRNAEAEPRSWRGIVGTGLTVVLVVLAFVVGTCVGAPEDPPPEDEHAEHAEPESGMATGTVWTCSMHPQIRMDEPGQCPICGMDLVPAEEEHESAHTDAAEAAAEVTLSPRARALAQVRTVPVERTEPRAQMRLLGRVEYDETRLHMVTPWTAGRIDKLHVRVTGARVRKGQVVATLYSPEVYAAMRDLVIAAKQAKKLAKGLHGSASLASAALESARERLRLLGVSSSQIAEIEKTGEAPTRIRIRSPYGGTVLVRRVEEGDYVATGTPLFHIADLSRVWIQIDAYESDLPYLSVGLDVIVEVDSLPDQAFEGKVAFIDPVVDERTRTARVRVEVSNEDGDLRPGMFAQAVIESELGTQASYLVIPGTAPLFTGRRSVVYVEVPGKPATYVLREVRLGPKAGPVYPVLAGLSEGERVVSQGSFVIDADLQLRGGRSMMTLADGRAAQLQEAVPVTPEILAALEPTMDAYLDAQEALAVDDFERARERLAELSTAANQVAMSGPSNTKEAWRGIASDLIGHAQHAARSSAEGDVRGAFEHVSTKVITLLRVFGNPTEESLRVAFCPMAFDNEGAEWVQRTDTINNPYYGVSMLRCGDVRATVLPGERLAAPTEAPPPPPAAAVGGHRH